MNHRAARTIQKRAEVVERPTQVQVRDIRVPVLVRSQRLNEAVHEVDNLVTTVMGNPGTTQASPSFF